MSSEPKELGTLIVVVGKARNLPNKSRFGKQDPYCSITTGVEKHKTKPIKRGGQHPEWDEELRFTIMEDVDDVLAVAESAAAESLKGKKDVLPPLPNEPGVVTPATLANKARKQAAQKKTSKTMKVQCFADDPKEPDLIGEAVVSIDEVLSKGEVDEWYELKSKDKYSGEVYLELTFYSNAAPPVKRDVPRPSANFGSGSLNGAARPGIPTSVSVTGMNLYIPPYGQNGRASSPAPPGQAAPPAPQPIAHSASFSELGLPLQHRMGTGGHRPGQPEFPPGHPGLVHQNSVGSVNSIDSLTHPMTAMSLGPSHSRISNVAQPPAPSPPAGPNHRHSVAAPNVPVSNNGQAPWAPLLYGAQQQHPPAAGAPPRPVSASDGSWVDPRASSAQPQRPLSSIGSGLPQPPLHHRTGSVTLEVPSGSYQLPYQTPPQPTGPPQSVTPMPQPIPPVQPGRTNSAVGYTHQQYPPTPQHSSSLPTVPTASTVPPQSSPGHATTIGNAAPYVPWYMQTQAAPSPPAPQHAQAAYGTSDPSPRPIPNPPPPPRLGPGAGYYPSDELYSQGNPPQVGLGGYKGQQPYPAPSQQQPSYSATPQPAQALYSSPPPPASQAPFASPPAPHPPHPSPFVAAYGQQPGYNSTPQPPADNSWNQSQKYNTPPPAPPVSNTAYYASQGHDYRPPAAPDGWNSGLAPNSSNPAPVRAPSPLPPQGGGRNTDWRTYMSGLSDLNSTSGGPPMPPLPPQRAVSPQPPPRPYGAQNTPQRHTSGQQDQWYTPPPVHASGGSNNGTPGRTAEWYTPPPAIPPSIIPGDQHWRPPQQQGW